MAVLCAVRLCAAVVLVEAVFNLTLVRSVDVGEEVHTEEIIPCSVPNKEAKFGSEGPIVRVRHTSETVWWSDLRVWIKRNLLSERGWPLVAILIVSQFVGKMLTEREAMADAHTARIFYSASRFMASSCTLSVVTEGSNEGDFVCVGIVFVLIGQLVKSSSRVWFCGWINLTRQRI